jgi:serine phosphatase RsbU (regulator of sigma subunit)
MLSSIVKMSNPLTVAFVCCLLSEIQNRIKYRDYISGITVEMQNIILSNELSLARSVHVNLLPARTPELQGIRLSTIYLPMIEIGGDLYDYMHFRDTGMHGIFICDVSGHGVSAALISSMVKAHLNTVTSINPSPANVLNYLNEKLIGQTSGHFVTAFFCMYDPAGKNMTFARGGHSYPLLMRNKEIIELTSSGGFIGIMKNRSFQEITIQLEPGDRLVFYTDGLIEARNPDGEMYGESRLVECLMTNSSTNIEAFIWKVFDSVIIFQSGKNFDDDVCLICMDIE